jgi:hypothetical protein
LTTGEVYALECTKIPDVLSHVSDDDVSKSTERMKDATMLAETIVLVEVTVATVWSEVIVTA